MKRVLLINLLGLMSLLCSNLLNAQTAPEQNPNFEMSRAKYMSIADSLSVLHGTTLQETYKAIDWMADRAEARAARAQFRQQLRLYRAQSYYQDYNYGSANYYPYNNYNYYRRPSVGFGNGLFSPWNVGCRRW